MTYTPQEHNRSIAGFTWPRMIESNNIVELRRTSEMFSLRVDRQTDWKKCRNVSCGVYFFCYCARVRPPDERVVIFSYLGFSMPTSVTHAANDERCLSLQCLLHIYTYIGSDLKFRYFYELAVRTTPFLRVMICLS